MEDELLQDYIYSILDKPYCFLCKNCTQKFAGVIPEKYCTVKKKYVPEFKLGNDICFEHQ